MGRIQAVLNALLQRDKLFLILTQGTLLLALFWYYPGNAPSGDAGYKYLQAEDLVRSGFSTFDCHYPSRDLDSGLTYIPFLEPFLYKINSSCYYVFPYALALINAPFFWLAGGAGLYLVSALGGMAILFLLHRLGALTGLLPRERSLLLLFSLGAYGFYNYSLGQNEYTLSAALATLAIYGMIRADLQGALLCGAATAINLQLRPETGLLALLLPAGFFLLRREVRLPVLALLAFLPGVIIFWLGNEMIFSNSMGLRGIVFMDYQPPGILDRLHRLGEYWFARRTSLLLQTPLLLAGLLVWWQAGKTRDTLWRLRLMFLCCLGYMIAIPLAVPNNPGPQFGERFLFNIFPALGLLAWHGMQKVRSRQLVKPLILVLWLYTMVTAFIQLREARRMDREVYASSKLLRRETQKAEAVILRTHILANAIFAHYRENRYFLAMSPERFSDLTQLLRERGIKTIAVVHSKELFRKLYGLDERFLPAPLDYETGSRDLGNDLFELRLYTLP
ncbi:MAG: hypothetical protein HS115_00765 [Spirochaetales bacterium]|nr:hypothetical protein [Spirochaetales bacterium]